MKILCDIGHPAHVHLFKNMLWNLHRKGHEFVISARDKDVVLQLLRAYRMPCVSLGKHYKEIICKGYGMLKLDYRLLKLSIEFKPDIFISHGSVYAAHIATAIGKPHISTEDTGNMEQIRLYKPFTRVILTSTCFPYDLGEKQIRYNGYHELAYLHPNYFKANPSILSNLGVTSGERYVLLRFTARKATHDISHKGLSIENKIAAAKLFSKYAKVFISSENNLPEDLKKYEMEIQPERMHDVLYYATLLYGESATMASECAILGTPAIFLYDSKLGYTDEEENRYGLVYNFTESLSDQMRSIKKGIDLLQQSNLKQKCRKKSKNLIKDKIDVTGFMVWFVENYPKSVKIMKTNPDYQLQFK